MLLKITAAAQRLGVTPYMLRRLAATGVVKSLRGPGERANYLFSTTEIDRIREEVGDAGLPELPEGDTEATDVR